MRPPLRTRMASPWIWIAIMSVSGCNSGSIPKGTQPNGPPKPPPVKADRPDSPEHRKAAIDLATAFAKTKYADRLDFNTPQTSYNDPSRIIKQDTPGLKGIPPAGSWEVMFRNANLHAVKPTGPSGGVELPSTDPTIAARTFLVLKDGTVKEGEPKGLPPQLAGVKR